MVFAHRHYGPVDRRTNVTRGEFCRRLTRLARWPRDDASRWAVVVRSRCRVLLPRATHHPAVTAAHRPAVGATTAQPTALPTAEPTALPTTNNETQWRGNPIWVDSKKTDKGSNNDFGAVNDEGAMTAACVSYGHSNCAANMFDGDNTTIWHCNRPNPCQVQLDLGSAGAADRVSGVRLTTFEDRVVSARLVVGEHTARLPSASCCFLLLLASVSCDSSRRSRCTHLAVNFRRLLPSPTVSQCLQNPFKLKIVYSPTPIPRVQYSFDGSSWKDVSSPLVAVPTPSPQRFTERVFDAQSAQYWRLIKIVTSGPSAWPAIRELELLTAVDGEYFGCDASACMEDKNGDGVATPDSDCCGEVAAISCRAGYAQGPASSSKVPSCTKHKTCCVATPTAQPTSTPTPQPTSVPTPQPTITPR